MNQEILNDTDIVNVMLDVINSPKQLPRVLSACFHLLKGICHSNTTVQNRLFHNLNQLLHCRAGHECSGWQNDMAGLVTAIFKNHKEICNHIKAHHIETMVRLLAQHTVAIPEILRALRFDSYVVLGCHQVMLVCPILGLLLKLRKRISE